MSTENAIIRTLTSSSNLRTRELCPGSAAAEEGIPDQPNEFSAEGTMLHELDADPTIDRSHLTEEQRETLELAARLDHEIFEAVLSQAQLPADEPYNEGREEERWFRRGFKSLFVGHNDLHRHYYERGVLVVIDKKFGRAPVNNAQENRQLMSYAVMAGDAVDAEQVYVAVNQPRLSKEDRVTIAHYDRAALKTAKELILSIWDAAHNEDGTPRKDAPRVAGEEQCKWCKAKLHCDAYRAKYAILEAPSKEPKEVFIQKLSQLTDDQLDQVYVAVKFADMIADAAKEEIIRRMDAGAMGNYIKSNTGSTTTINDNARALLLLEDAGLPSHKITRPVTTTELVEVARSMKDITKKEAEILVKSILEPVSTSTPKAPTLKRRGAPIPLPQ